MNNYNPWMLHLSYELDSSNGCFGNEGAEERLLKKMGVKGVEGVRTTSNRRIKETQIAR
jgi:hypothetical protein